MLELQSALGVVVLLAFAWAISEHRRAVHWRSAGAALVLTLLPPSFCSRFHRSRRPSPLSRAPSTR
jgi:nucleoside permease NupC